MTAPLLLAYIGAAFLAQLAVVIGVVVWRRRRAVAEMPAVAAGEATRALLGAWPGWRDFRVAHREFEDSAKTQCSFYLEPVDGAPLPLFKPGQFLTFSLQVAGAADGVQAEERAITRCYSLSDRPDPARYRITIKRVPAPAGRSDLPPGASSTHFHDKVHAGDVLKVRTPAGHFFIDPDPHIQAVLIAGGIGITPMMSMLRWSLAGQPERTVRLYYGLRHSFKAMLEQLAGAYPNFHLNVVYSRPLPGDVQGRDFQYTGHVDLDLLRLTLPHGRHKFYVCGPAPMMESLLTALSGWGVPQEDIHHEAFGPDYMRSRQGPQKEAVSSHSTPSEVKFHRSGRTLAWDGQDATLLDFAERHGIAVESGCRSGSCGSCETKVLSGTVRYADKPDYEIAAGHCLLCVGTPESALSIEA